MGLFKQIQTEKKLPLLHHTRIGRSEDSDLCLDDRRVSSEHAIIVWNTSHWELRDLGSRNGTVIDGRRVDAGARVPLRQGASIHFGSQDEHWVLQSEKPPEVLGLCVSTGQTLEGEHGHLQFDSETQLLTDDGVDYWIEQAGERSSVHDREVVQIGKERWRVSLPPPAAVDNRTITSQRVILPADVSLRFHVSPDEEHVQIHLLTASRVEKELRPRSFDYMLLALARARLADEASGSIPESEQGWVFADELARSLGIDISHVNVDVYRARRRFSDVGVQRADDMIARRAQTRALRLECGRLEIL